MFGLWRRTRAEAGQLVGRPRRTVLVRRQHAYHGMHAAGTSLSGIPANAAGHGELIADVGLPQRSGERGEQFICFGIRLILQQIRDSLLGAGAHAGIEFRFAGTERGPAIEVADLLDVPGICLRWSISFPRPARVDRLRILVGHKGSPQTPRIRGTSSWALDVIP